ncbi:MAG TPA: hypothetical protein VMW47_08135 [Verrucomicrobiae bacterium]|nr:hypothetical protein [Verrucomicrobiae bacterium]
MPPFRHSLDRIGVAFDDPHAVAHTGLPLPATLAQKLGVPALVDRHVDLGTASGHAHVGLKAMTVVAAMLAGADRIDDTGALRASATGAVLRHRLRGALDSGDLPAQLHLWTRPAVGRGVAGGAGPCQGGRGRAGGRAADDRPGLHHL